MNGYFNQVISGDDAYVHIYPKFVFPADRQAYFYPTVQPEQYLHQLANIFYGDPSFWTLIALANNIYDPFEDMTGRKIRVLKPERVADVSIE